MLINRSKLWLAVVLPLLFASNALGQELPDYEWVPGIRDFQPFAPASSRTSAYGSGTPRQRGWFFTIEDLAWSTSAPDRTTVGFGGYNPLVSSDGQNFFQQQNTMDTGFIQPSLRQGERLQLGYVGEDGKGWMVGTFVVHSQTSVGGASNAGVSFYSPLTPGVPGNETEGFIDNMTNGAFLAGNGPTVLDTDVNHNGIFGQDGRGIFQNVGGVSVPVGVAPAPVDYGDLIQLPITFQEVVTKYTSRVFGVEVMRTWWLSKSRRADHGFWDVMAGVRYLRFRDQFFFSGTGYDESSNATITGLTGNTVTGPAHLINGILSNTQFNQTADNNIVGGQLGLRWTKQRGRLGIQVEGRGAAAANFQTARQTGDIADRPDHSSLAVPFTHTVNPNQAALIGASGSGNTTGALPVLQYDTPFLHSAGVNHTNHATRFSPIGELRVNATYQIFRNIQFTVGWTGLVIGGVARSPNIVSYTLPDLGIKGANQQAVFIQGINFGLNVNR